MKHNYSKSIRLPKEHDDFMTTFAQKWNVSTSYCYRQAVLEFIRRHTTGA